MSIEIEIAQRRHDDNQKHFAELRTELAKISVFIQELHSDHHELSEKVKSIETCVNNLHNELSFWKKLLSVIRTIGFILLAIVTLKFGDVWKYLTEFVKGS